MSEAGDCKHFNGIQHDECAAGVNYRKLAGDPRTGMALRLPCLVKHRGQIHCPKLYEVTKELIEEVEEEARMSMKNVLTARAAIVENIGTWVVGQSGESGQLPCPICETGTLRFSRSGVNGHIHAGCSTETCVRWME